MKKMTLVCALMAFAVLMSGCDMFRRMAGRPTSKDIAEMRALIESDEREEAARKETALKAIRDSVEAFQRDSAAMAEVLGTKDFLVSGTNLISKSAKQALPDRYLIVIGAFRDQINAQKLADSIGEKGHETVLIRYCNGCTAVALDPCGTLVDAYRAFQRAKSEGLCPKDAWVMDANQ